MPHPRIQKNKSPNRMRLGKLTSLSVKFFGPTSQEQDYGAVALRGVSGKSIDEHLAKRHNLPVWHGTWSFTYISAHCAVKDSNSGNYINGHIGWNTWNFRYMKRKLNLLQVIPNLDLLKNALVVWLVVSTHLKNISQNGNLPQIGLNIKTIWNHHLVV